MVGIRFVCHLGSNDFESLVPRLTFSKSDQQASASYGVGVQTVEILTSSRIWNLSSE